MRIISFGDVHMSLGMIERLGPELEMSDLVLICGDLTSFGGPEDAEKVLTAVSNHALALLAVAGNLDQTSVVDYLRRQRVSLHGRAVHLDNLGIFGCGGSNKTPMNTPTEYEEEEITRVLEKAHAQVAHLPQRLMLCHTPPADTRTDVLWNGMHVGSPAVREFIEKHQPDLCLTGHIHEAAGTDRIGRTLIINPGALSAGGYVAVHVNGDTLHAELRHLS